MNDWGVKVKKKEKKDNINQILHIAIVFPYP